MSPRRNNVARREAEGNIVPEGRHFGVPPPTEGTIYYIAFTSFSSSRVHLKHNELLMMT